MSSFGSELALLGQVARDLMTTRYITVASFTALVYELLVTLPDEIAFIWQAPWTSGKVLYFSNRYPILLEGIAWVAYTLDLGASPEFCKDFTFLDAWATFVFIVPVQIIVVLRTVALWGKNPKVIAFLVFVVLATDAVMIAFTALSTKSLKFEEMAFLQPVFGCNSGLESFNERITIPAWVALMVFDTVVFAMTLIRIIHNFRYARTRIVNVLFRDGFLYYCVMLLSTIGNLVIYAALPPNRTALTGALLPVIRASMSIVGSRIILNLRAETERTLSTASPLDSDVNWKRSRRMTSSSTSRRTGDSEDDTTMVIHVTKTSAITIC